MAANIDRLSALLEEFPVRAGLFHNGPLCGTTVFDAAPGRAFLHVLRGGATEVVHAPGVDDLPRRLALDEPTLLFYPSAVGHRFHNPPREGSDFVCATIAFAGGDAHPIVRALPPVVAVPLRLVPGLDATLRLLFRETEQVRCGSRLVADRLFEVLVLQLLRWLLDQDVARVGLVAGLGDRRLAPVLTAVHEHPCDEWTVARMAAIAGMSRSAFASHFRDVLGTTPAEFVAEWRLARACRMLRQGKALSLVADEVGYSSYTALSRAFRQRKGLSPREWLRLDACA